MIRVQDGCIQLGMTCGMCRDDQLKLAAHARGTALTLSGARLFWMYESMFRHKYSDVAYSKYRNEADRIQQLRGVTVDSGIIYPKWRTDGKGNSK